MVTCLDLEVFLQGVVGTAAVLSVGSTLWSNQEAMARPGGAGQESGPALTGVWAVPLAAWASAKCSGFFKHLILV